MENDEASDSAFEKSILEIFNYHYHPDELKEWLIRFTPRLKPFAYLEFDLSRAINQPAPDYDEVIRLLAKFKNLETDRARFSFLHCLQCNTPVGIPSLGSFASYGRDIAVSARGFYFLHTDSFNAIWDLVDKHVEERFITSFEKRHHTRNYILEKLIDPIYNQEMHLSGFSEYRYCPKCGSANFSGQDRSETGVLICATYHRFNTLDANQKDEIIKAHLETFLQGN